MGAAAGEEAGAVAAVARAGRAVEPRCDDHPNPPRNAPITTPEACGMRKLAVPTPLDIRSILPSVPVRGVAAVELDVKTSVVCLDRRCCVGLVSASLNSLV
ncbi:hypothetical protein Psuf_020320 [Phytohabitans suffuscus]|uniref:Uncharacterized protein n=1 Tax=Phytohabitans suffuscus TaxID=624315 RepID=A0A6F8YFC7_9ACTN|nr:hypothetical protein Psuf_020320 [Phytohabitans suffuscus]